MSSKDIIVNEIFFNAWSSTNDVTGEDNFGYSVIWFDLDSSNTLSHNYVVPRGVQVSDNESVTAWFKTHKNIKGNRWVLIKVTASGDKSIESFKTREEMAAKFKEYEKLYYAWLGL